ncbi:heme-binding protein 1-like [Chanos chanos]|uniref:Heme-binding protein 1-like n=1 Tax=Chanos chanos TaxID=29144 RepID=A0A6J2V6Q5_CHACN|nr:heme-binding protein 1-like [Chanos chanos]
MDRAICRLNGGCSAGESRGETSEPRPSRGLITLEELESLTEDLDSHSALGRSNSPVGESVETMEVEERDRLLHFWQDVGRGHQVDVPRDMAEPIQLLTTDMENNQEREKIPSTLLTKKEKCGVLLYEKRNLEKLNWACITVREETYEQSICLGFMKLMRYICQQNSSGNYLGMTIPIITVVQVDDIRSTLLREVTVAYYLPQQYQDHPPQPLDPEISIETWPAMVVYSRPFNGITNEASILGEIRTLTDVLGSLSINTGNSFIIAGYTSPAALHRHNEIWFLERH